MHAEENETVTEEKDKQEPAKALPARKDLPEEPLESKLPPKEVTKPAGGKQHRSFITWGERIHKGAAYIGIDWLFNTTSAVTFSYWGTFFKSGQKWNGAIDYIFARALKPSFKQSGNIPSFKQFINNDEAFKTFKATDYGEAAGRGTLFANIVVGGMFAFIPLIIVESQKIKLGIIKSLDKMIYGKKKVESAEFQESYEEIKKEPKKDFATGMLARAFALAPLLASVLHKRTNALIKKLWYSHIGEDAEWAINKTNVFGNKEEGKKGLFGMQLDADRRNYIRDTFSVDFGLTLPYATMLHPFFFNLFANLKAAITGKKKEKASQDPEAPDTLPHHARNNDTSTPATVKREQDDSLKQDEKSGTKEKSWATGKEAAASRKEAVERSRMDVEGQPAMS